jgi:hypothetical protein
MTYRGSGPPMRSSKLNSVTTGGSEEKAMELADVRGNWAGLTAIVFSRVCSPPAVKSAVVW